VQLEAFTHRLALFLVGPHGGARSVITRQGVECHGGAAHTAHL
jgi:hypothetical protein